jgi:hypothetical protein
LCQYIHVLSQLENSEVPVHNELCYWIQAIIVRGFNLYTYALNTTGVAEERDGMKNKEYNRFYCDAALYYQIYDGELQVLPGQFR